ncbi:MAG: hypothetical protein V8S58_13770, partial [Lachnospiraceae bacterium]
WGNKRWSYKGYKTLDDLYKDVVTAQSDSFNHEENIDESAAPASVEKTDGHSDWIYIAGQQHGTGNREADP